MRLRALGLGLALSLVSAASTAAGADHPPEVARVRIPADKVASFFPPGTELRVLPVEEFESLVRSARLGAIRSDAKANEGGPSLLRARHQIRVEEGLLTGRSELVVQASAPSASSLLLDPWSPALLSAGEAWTSAGGQLALPADGDGTRTHVLTWEQRARPGSEGRSFDLALPASAATRLSLDVAASLVPEIVGALRQGPSPGSASDRRSWRFDGPGGPWSIRLRPADEARNAPGGWFSGETRIDLSESPTRWRLQGTIDLGRAGTRRFGIRLDPGLDLIDVAGPSVASYRAEAEDEDGVGTLLSIRLEDAADGPSPIVVRALARSPEDGVWALPAASPEGATWTGGRTLVRLGPSRVVSACVPGAGRQVAPTTEEREFAASRGGLLLAFEATAPSSVASLKLRRPPADASAEVWGEITLGAADAPRLDARLTWRAEHGRIPTLAADLPPGWSAEKIQIRGQGEPTDWHAESRPGGGSRIVVHPPPTLDPRAPIRLDIAAAAGDGDRAAPLELPRVSPVGSRVSDEIWQLRADPGITVSPRKVVGLVWLDPAGLAEAAPSAAPRLPAIMAWRWTAADGRAVLTRPTTAAPPSARAWTRVAVRRDRLVIDAYLLLGEGASLDVPVVFSGAGADFAPRWDVPDNPSRLVESAALPEGDRARMGIAPGASAWRLRVPGASRGPVMLHSRIERPWSGSGGLPLLVVLDRPATRGTLLVRVDRGLLAELAAPGLTALNASSASSEFEIARGAEENTVSEAGGAEVPSRPSLAYEYGPSVTPPNLTSRHLPPASHGGWIESATLSTRLDPDGHDLNHLAMRIVPGPARDVEIAFPTGQTLDRAEVEGRPSFPTRHDRRLWFVLPNPSPTRGAVELTLDYRGPALRGGSVRPNRPESSLPCLAFGWSLQLSDAFDVTSSGRGLRTADATPRRTLEPSFWPRRGSRSIEDAAAVRRIEERARSRPPAGRALGDWLAILDGGDTPIVVDRAALASAGWGPRSSTVVPADSTRRRRRGFSGGWA